MSEYQNPLNDFLNAEDGEENELFADFSVSAEETTVPPQAAINASAPADGAAAPQTVAPARAPETPTQPQQTLFADAVAQTPSATTQVTAETDPFTAALKRAQAQSDSRLTERFAEIDAIFSYGKAEDAITDRDMTFEDLRAKYETDFPELSESKKVSWTVSYGKVNKSITSPGSVKVYDIKAEIESSKAFIDGIKKAKTDAEKSPKCLVKPKVTAQQKGEILKLPAYKDCCTSIEEAKKSGKSIILLPSKDGRIYQMRKTPVGNFTAPAENILEFQQIHSGFEMTLPKIPIHLLMRVLNFFRQLSDRNELEALVHILYDTDLGRYTLCVPKQELTHTSVHCVLEEEYPDHLIHVMDIHSHNTMPAKFSGIDDDDEKATRLYAVVGRLDRVLPDITLRASCGGQFIPLRCEEVFETGFKAYPYPSEWNDRICERKPTRRVLRLKAALSSSAKEGPQ